MTLLYRDRDRLLVSVFLSLLLFLLLFVCLDLFLKIPLTPFPETTTLLLVDLQTDQVLGEPERQESMTTVPSPPKELIQPITGSQAPALSSSAQQAPASPEIPAVSSPASPPVAKVPSPSSAPREPEGVKTVEPRTERSPYPLRNEPVTPIPPRIQPFTPSEARDPLAAEREFLQSEKTKLESWLRENVSSSIPSPATPSAKVEPVPSPPTDPMVQKVTEQLEAINRRLAQLETSSKTLQQIPQEGKEPVSQEPLKPIYDREGREIGKGELRGRVPLYPLNIGRILPEDFEGFPIQNLELRAEFLIGESGLLEPGSLKIFGDSRYTRIVEKVRSALEKWRFDSRPGVKTQAVIHFLIKVRGM